MEYRVTANAKAIDPTKARVSVHIDFPETGGITITDILVREKDGKVRLTLPLGTHGNEHPVCILRGNLKQRVFDAAIAAYQEIGLEK